MKNMMNIFKVNINNLYKNKYILAFNRKYFLIKVIFIFEVLFEEQIYIKK